MISLPSIQYVQLTSAIAQQAQQMSVVLPDRGRKAPFPRTRRRAYGILQSADSSAFPNGAESHIFPGDQLKLKRLFDSRNAAFSKIPGVCHLRHTPNTPYGVLEFLFRDLKHKRAAEQAE